MVQQTEPTRALLVPKAARISILLQHRGRRKAALISNQSQAQYGFPRIPKFISVFIIFRRLICLSTVTLCKLCRGRAALAALLQFISHFSHAYTDYLMILRIYVHTVHCTTPPLLCLSIMAGRVWESRLREHLKRDKMKHWNDPEKYGYWLNGCSRSYRVYTIGYRGH